MNAEQAKRLTDKYSIKRERKNKKLELKWVKKTIKENTKKGDNTIIYSPPCFRSYLYESTKQWLSDNGYEFEERKEWGDVKIRW